jgi:DNA-directed RNA polymerase subunit alpha
MAHEINLPQLPKVIKKEDNSSTIQIDGCHPGYGITLANTIRRVLYSSLPGTAATAFKINGVNHEFSTIPHVIEDVIQIGLSLKKLCFSSQDSLINKEVKATIQVKGEKIVKASDIKTPLGVEVTNKDLVIATLSDKKAELDMEITISGGYGYERAEERKKEKLSIGEIGLDAFYSPIVKVNYRVEDMRIGERTDFNKIIMNILTDGSIDAEEAFSQACGVLEGHFSFLGKLKESSQKLPTKTKKVKSSSVNKKSKTVNEIPKKLIELGLEEKIVSSLESAGIKSVNGLVKKSSDQIKEIKGLGDKALSTIKRKLKKFELSLKA